MKRGQGMCVFIGALIAGTLLGGPEGLHSKEFVDARAASGAALRLQSNLAARATEAPQSANSHTIAGDWQGVLVKFHVMLKIDEAAGGSFSGKLTIVEQGATLPLEDVSYTSVGAFRFEVKAEGISYEAQLSADGTELVGTFRQGGNAIPLSFRRPGAAPRVTLKPRTIGSISFEPCRTADGNQEALCGKYSVPENRQLRGGRKIALNILVLPSKAEKPESDPFFALAGGPGQAATEAFPVIGYVARVRELREVVLIDQRGMGQSNPLPCALQALDDAQSILGEGYSTERIRECRAESDKKADTTQYTTSIAAVDLDAVRQAMGYDKINLFGGSYGTRAALVYVRLYGNHVRTLTLEAVAPPQVSIPLPFAKALQSSLDGVIAFCSADAGCQKAYPDLRKEFLAVVERLDKSPAQFQINNQSVTLSREMFLSRLRSLLYVPQFVSALPYFIHSAHKGDWSPYAGAVLALRRSIESGVARGAFLGVMCAEDVPALTEAAIRRETAGTYLGDSAVRRYQQYCKAWGAAGSIPKDYHAPVRSKTPALLISGALDPATPPEGARLAARSLTNSRQVIVKQGTHGTGSPCVDGLIADFVKQGSTSVLDDSCVNQIHLPPFVTATNPQ